MLRTFFAETEQDEEYWRRMARRLQTAKDTTVHGDRLAEWVDWLKRHAATVVQTTGEAATDMGWDRNFIYRDIARVPTGPLSPANLQRGRNGLQAWLGRRLLNRDGYDVEARVRHRSVRWKFTGIARYTATRQVRNLGRLRRAVPPRVQAATISTIMNRWTTDARMRKLRPDAPNRCLLGCT